MDNNEDAVPGESCDSNLFDVNESLFDDTTEVQIARAWASSEADQIAQDIQAKMERDNRDEAIARAYQEAADAEAARELEAQEWSEFERIAREGERVQTKRQDRRELGRQWREQWRKEEEERHKRRNPAAQMYSERHREMEEDATVRANIDAPQRTRSRTRMDLTEEDDDYDDGNQWIIERHQRHRRRRSVFDTEEYQPFEQGYDGVDPLSRRIDQARLSAWNVTRRSAMATAAINPNPDRLSLTPTGTRPGLRVLSPSPPLLTHWRSLRREGRANRSLDRIESDYILSNTYIEDVNDMLDGMFGLQQDQAAAVIESFTRDPSNTIPGREVEFVESEFRSWTIRVLNSNLQQRLPYSDYGQDRAAYNNLPDDCLTNGCYARCPAPRSKEDERKSLKIGRMIQRREMSRRGSGSSAKVATGVLPKSSPPQPQKLTLKLRLLNEQQKSDVVSPPPVDHSKDIPSNAQAQHAMKQLEKLYAAQRQVTRKKYQVLEDLIQDDIEAMRNVRTRHRRDQLERQSWNQQTQLYQNKRQWVVRSGATKNTRPGYYKFADIVKPTRGYYSRKVPSSRHRGMIEQSNEHRSSSPNTRQHKENELTCSNNPNPTVTRTKSKRPQQSAVHKRVEAWMIDPDAY
ncbi:uncharacterized protein K460DRAFT_96308 [Cucurbitaria berberidis CBS 394.84]|uniref:Uncharacterized protein n=1 Tax=Cucurbitaria berberidis CBS 394.84 TaxID=1168544 RepID=A0A9P4GFM4_9PLEO|nr:uncharacterized protein K460DRAFT_96308 [Cucurbitaria berberidis CBS 394.84]KAF1844680.1 hypothetical protein K460DRAFT_96308 [Cucurbitaria berberidis CBS 394.84]